MPGDRDTSQPRVEPRHGKGAGSPEGFLRLLRGSHIFAAAVREILDVKLLRQVSPSPLTPAQFQLLKLMSYNGVHQLGEVADYLGVSPPAATKNIDKLERLGFVARTPSTGDRRATLLSVSAKGRRLVRKYEQHRTAYLTPAFETFEPREVRQFVDLLERFSKSLLSLETSGQRYCLRCAGYVERDCPVSQVHGGCPYLKVRNARSGNRAAENTS